MSSAGSATSKGSASKDGVNRMSNFFLFVMMTFRSVFEDVLWLSFFVAGQYKCYKLLVDPAIVGKGHEKLYRYDGKDPSGVGCLEQLTLRTFFFHSNCFQDQGSLILLAVVFSAFLFCVCRLSQWLFTTLGRISTRLTFVMSIWTSLFLGSRYKCCQFGPF